MDYCWWYGCVVDFYEGDGLNLMMCVMIFVVGCGDCMCLLIDYMFKFLFNVGGKLLIVW